MPLGMNKIKNTSLCLRAEKSQNKILHKHYKNIRHITISLQQCFSILVFVQILASYIPIFKDVSKYFLLLQNFVLYLHPGILLYKYICQVKSIELVCFAMFMNWSKNAVDDIIKNTNKSLSSFNCKLLSTHNSFVFFNILV